MRKPPAVFLIIFLAIVAMGFWSCGGSSSSGPNPPNPAFTGDCTPLPLASLTTTYSDKLSKFVTEMCYRKQGWQHDIQPRSAEGAHVKNVWIWYSPSLFNWLNNRVGPPPDGAMIVKEEDISHPTGPPDAWSVMVRNSKLWWDGWYWAVVGNEGASSSAAAPAQTGGCPDNAVFPGNGPSALTCWNCHSSAISGFPGTGTYSSTVYVKGFGGQTGTTSSDTQGAMPADAIHEALAAHRGVGALGAHRGVAPSQVPVDPDTSGFTGRLPSSIFANVKPLAAVDIPCMVPESSDAVASLPASSPTQATTSSQFLTSDTCGGCHEANDLVHFPTNMLYTDPATGDPVNLSQRGEWRYSMMGLAGRDPIFFAQLDTESTVHDNLKGQANPPAYIQDTCLSCHASMGQRQYHIDKGNDPSVLFTRDILQDPTSPYGALGREGISCMTCHQIADIDLDDPSTYTGKFHLNPPGQVFGPFPSADGDVKVGHSVVPRPMKLALGIEPIFGAQMARSNVCESCHTIVLPVYDANGNQVNTDFEQTTYFEWLNSSFAPSGSSPQSCQDCHMRGTYKGVPMQFKIASIEDDGFPRYPTEGSKAYPVGSTTLPANQITVEVRNPYPRHTLLGINLFALEMFDQFRTDLGLYAVDGWLPVDASQKASSQHLAVFEATTEAQSNTAVVTVGTPSKSGGNLQADVTVKSLVGHNFPSGVSFRRAFLDFQVLDGSGKVLWESGGTDANGVIVDTAGNQLVTEFYSPTQQTTQPHFWTGNPITSDEQVQVYEEIIRDPQGMVTTSFLSLDKKVKDNRIQALGRSSSGPNAGIIASVGVAPDPNYRNGCGCSVVRYQIPLTPALANATNVQATLYYQTIPPYYLRQRSEDATGPDTQRLINYASQLDTTKYTEIANWKLKINTSGPVAIP
jgi:hypothetical protein